MNKKWARTGALAVTCLAVGAVLASTGTAQAAGTSLLSVFVSNDAAHPVPVKGTVTVANLPSAAPVQNEKLYFGDVQAQGPGAGIDVTAYREIRMTVNSGGRCTAANPGEVTLLSNEGLVFDTFDFSYPEASPVNKVYEVPGSTLSISVSGPSDCFAAIAIYGRTN